MEQALILISAIPQIVSDYSVVTWTLAEVSWWWLMGYLMVVMAILLSRGFQLRLWVGMFVWCGLHVLISQSSFQKETFRLTTYSVGHGIAILMEFPDGKRFLYDCGSNDGGHNAARAILDDFRMRRVIIWIVFICPTLISTTIPRFPIYWKRLKSMQWSRPKH